MAVRKRYILMAGVIAVLAVLAVIVLLIVLLLFAWVQLTTAPTIEFKRSDSQQAKVEKTEAWLEKLHQSGNFNGFILAIKDDEVLISNCWGYTDASRTRKLTPQSSMRLASVSKQFTAAAILVLAEQGKIGIDDPVASRLDGFPFEDVTIRHLLNMSSGLPDCYMELAEKHRDKVGECLTNSDVTKLIIAYPPTRSAPVNAEHSYSNTSYVLLAGIVESVSGISFEQFLTDEIFDPLGMKNSRVWNLVSEIEPGLEQAKSFLVNENQSPDFLDGVAGDGAVFCSLEDFEIWNQFWRGNELVSEELMKQAFVQPTLANGSKSDYGFGWVIQGDGHWHNGAWLGARTFTHQDDDFYLVVVDNSSSLIIDSMGAELIRALD